jgi:WD repeat-containing protein 61
MVEQFKFEGHNLGVVGVSAHGYMAASVGLDCTIRLWDLRDGVEIKCIEGGPSDAWSICFSPDGTKLATGANNGNVRVCF